MVAVGALASACAQPTAQVIEKEVPVEKIVKETVVVQKEVAVEKVVTATPVKMKYKEAPMLAGLVQAGKLPPVDERLPEDPMVQPVAEGIGQYGGTWHRLAVSAGDIQLGSRLTATTPVHWNDTGTEIFANVVSSYEISPDGKVFTFKLRKGMKWSDGEPFTADDMLWYPVQHCGNKELAPSFPVWLAPGGTPVKAEKIDEYNVRLTFGAPAGVFIEVLAAPWGPSFGIYPAHYCKQFHPDFVDKAKLEAAAKAAGFEFWYQLYGNRTAGTAMKNLPEYPVIDAWRVTVPPPKQPAVAERNPYFWKVDPEGNQLPYIDRIEHMIVQGADQVNLRAMSGEVDMQLRHTTFDNYPLYIENEAKGDYRIVPWDRGYVTDALLFFGVGYKDLEKRALLQDKRLHYALSLGINRQEIIDAVYLGVTEPTQISPLPSSPHYWEEAAKDMNEYDPKRANGYLDEMGLTKRDAEGYRLMADGKRLTIFFEYGAVFGAWGAIAELLKAHWKELGVDLNIAQQDRTLFDTREQAAEVEMGIWTSSSDFNPLLESTCPYINWMGGPTFYTWRNSNGKQGEEPPEWMRKQWEWFDAAKSTIDPEEQKKLVRQILEVHKDQKHTLGICTSPPEVVVVKNNFRNVPEVALSDYMLLSPGNTCPEQYYIKSS